MAVVPRYSLQTEAASVLPNVRISDQGATPEAFGAGVGAAVGQIAQVVHQIGQHEQEKADTARMMEAQKQVLDVDQALLNDPDNGAFAQQGKNALGLSQRVLPQWDQRVSQITDGLPTHLRQRFEEFTMQRRATTAEQLARHTLAEGNRYYTSTAKDTMERFQSDAITNRTDPKAVDQAANGAGQAAVEWANRQGLDPETYGKAAISTTYRGVLEAQVAEDPNGAIKRYGEVKPYLTGVDQASFEKTLQPYLLDTGAKSWVDAQLGGGALPTGTLPVEGAAKSEADADAVARASVGRILGLESGGQADAKNPNSSATGAGQFVRNTWLDVVKRNFPDVAAGKSDAQLLALRSDPELSRKATEAYAVENCRKLYAAGFPVTPETAYLCHHFGSDGAMALLRAPADAKVSSVLPAQVLNANPYLNGKTVADLVANHAARAGDTVGVGAMTADGKPDWAGLYTRAEAIPNPLQRRAAEEEIGHRRAIAEAAEASQNRAMTDAVFSAAYAAPVGQKPEQYLNPTQLAWAQRENRVETLTLIAKRRATDSLVQTDPIVADALYRESVADPATFAKRNLLAEAGEKLDTQDLTALKARQAAITKGDSAARADWSNDQQRIVTILRGLGAGKVKADDPKAAAVSSAFRQAKQALIARLDGKKPTPEQEDIVMRSVQTNLARDIADGGWARVQRQGSAAESYGLELGKKVSAADYNTTRDVLAKHLGRAPTEVEIVDAMRRYYGTP